MNEVMVFMKRKNLVYWIWEVLGWLGIGGVNDKEMMLDYLRRGISDVGFVEKLIGYLNEQFRISGNDYELRSNLCDLIDNLNYLKQCMESYGVSRV